MTRLVKSIPAKLAQAVNVFVDCCNVQKQTTKDNCFIAYWWGEINFIVYWWGKINFTVYWWGEINFIVYWWGNINFIVYWWGKINFIVYWWGKINFIVYWWGKINNHKLVNTTKARHTSGHEISTLCVWQFLAVTHWQSSSLNSTRLCLM